MELSFLFVIAMRLGLNFLSSIEERLLISISIAAIVSAVSPDWVTPIVYVFGNSGGGEYRNSLA